MHEPKRSPHILPESFYARHTVTVARDLLGCTLVSVAGGVETSGRIVETEAYLGVDDPGSHAATKGVTTRNAVMFGAPGHAYVYFTYGNHNMLNVVTEPTGTAGGVLIRALEPLTGLDVMLRRRMAGRHQGSAPVGERDLANGPGKLAAALGVVLADNGGPLDGSATLSILGPPECMGDIASSGRIGLSHGHELELRFYVEGNPYVSGAREGLRPARSRTGKGVTG